MDPDWLTRQEATLEKSVCADMYCMCKRFDDSAGIPAFRGEILSKGTITQSAPLSPAQ